MNRFRRESPRAFPPFFLSGTRALWTLSLFFDRPSAALGSFSLVWKQPGYHPLFDLGCPLTRSSPPTSLVTMQDSCRRTEHLLVLLFVAGTGRSSSRAPIGKAGFGHSGRPEDHGTGPAACREPRISRASPAGKADLAGQKVPAPGRMSPNRSRKTDKRNPGIRLPSRERRRRRGRYGGFGSRRGDSPGRGRRRRRPRPSSRSSRPR